MARKDRNEEAAVEVEVPEMEVEVPEDVAVPGEQLVSVCEMTLPENAEAQGIILVAAKKNGKTCTLAYEFGKDLEQMIERFGKEVVFSQARAEMVVKMQAVMRSYLVGGKDPKEILGMWKPGVAMPKTAVNKEVATLNYFDGLDPEAQKAMLEKLMAKVAGK